MTELEALTSMKRQCKILETVLTDSELIGFLDDHKSRNGIITYDIRRSIHAAASSVITVTPQHFSRGGVITIYHDLLKVIKQFEPPRKVLNIVRKFT